jgi:hypothetical protein
VGIQRPGSAIVLAALMRLSIAYRKRLPTLIDNQPTEIRIGRNLLGNALDPDARLVRGLMPGLVGTHRSGPQEIDDLCRLASRGITGDDYAPTIHTMGRQLLSGWIPFPWISRGRKGSRGGESGPSARDG